MGRVRRVKVDTATMYQVSNGLQQVICPLMQKWLDSRERKVMRNRSWDKKWSEYAKDVMIMLPVTHLQRMLF